MAINTALYLHAQIALEGYWQERIVTLLSGTECWFAVEAVKDSLDALCIRVVPTGKTLSIVKRAQSLAPLAIREKCPYQALLLMAICKEFKTAMWDETSTEVNLTQIDFGHAMFAGSGLAEEDMKDMASKLKLVVPRLISIDTGPDIFSL